MEVEFYDTDGNLIDETEILTEEEFNQRYNVNASKEIVLLYDATYYSTELSLNPGINLDIFPNYPISELWTSTISSTNSNVGRSYYTMTGNLSGRAIDVKRDVICVADE